ncbi:MAG: metallophosphoesterase [Cellvibrionaceae bacterium]
MIDYIHFQFSSSNPTGRDFVLADLHGCYSILQKALQGVSFDPKHDRVFSVGDIIDRGPDSLACLRLLQEPWFHAVQGNHENMMLAALHEGPGSATWTGWMGNGGSWFDQLSETDEAELKSLLPLVAKLPITRILATRSGKRVGISHAQPPTFDWHRLSEKRKLTGDEIWRALWSREAVHLRGNRVVEGVDATVHGHTIVTRPTRIGNMNFIDTGVYLFNAISLIELSDEFITGRMNVA